MDNLLRDFHLDTRMHENAISHAKEKGMKLNELNLFTQPETWDLLTELIEKGEYHTTPTEIHYIDKLTDRPLTYDQAIERNMENVREIYVMTKTDRVIWNMFYQLCYKKFSHLIHPLCKSYKKGESTVTVARELSGRLEKMRKYYGVKNDLSKFFDSVPIKVIDELLDKLEALEPSAIWKPIREFYHDNRVIINGELVERYGSLKQGCAFACLLADLVLRDIDEEMTKYDVIYYRYSDDFIIIGKDKYKAEKKYLELLNEKGIKINFKKQEALTHLNWFTFLGFRFKGNQVSIGEKTFKHMRQRIKDCTIHRCNKMHRGLTKLEIIKTIDYLQNYFFATNPKNKGGMATYMFGAVRNVDDIQLIDDYIKDCLRASYTNRCEIYGLGISYGKNGIRKCKGKNVGINNAKAYHIPQELGWYSLNHMRNKYMQGKEVYKAEILKMNNGYIVEV